jgi:hypothetical protein
VVAAVDDESRAQSPWAGPDAGCRVTA